MVEKEILSTAETIEFPDYGVTRGNSLYWKWFVYSMGTKTPQVWGLETIEDALAEIPKLRVQQIEWREKLVAKGIINA